MLEHIKEIVKEASHFMKKDGIEIEIKGNESNYVTSADIAVQNFLIQKLTGILPGSTVVGEENNCINCEGEYVWVIDPIDGTSNFIRDIGISGISVALIKNGEPYIGVIYQPYTDEMFYAEVGKGAFLNGKQIYVSDRDFSHSHFCAAMSLYDKRHAKACFNIIEKVYSQSDDLRRLGSAAVELACLAAGRVELYFEIRVFPWDAAAAMTIVREAGGYVECLFQEKMPLDKPFGIIGANTKENLEILKKIVYEELRECPY